MSASTSRQAIQRVIRPIQRLNRPSKKNILRFSTNLSAQPVPQAELLTSQCSSRRLSTKAGKQPMKERYNFNTSLNFSEEPDPDHVNYRRVTAADVANRREPPTKVKMLVRDFIDDSLYNANYGYFARNVSIFTPPAEGFDFSSFRDTAAFQEAVAERYEREYAGVGDDGLGRQVWHTPTELFKPHYTRALVSAILNSYKLNHFPYEDLIIYEVGAGNGSFMIDCLTFLKEEHPEVFARTKYRIIEISGMLAKGQKSRAASEGFRNKVEVVNEDFFKWQGGTTEPCYVVALEVFDNFAHDMIRYDIPTLSPLQAVVSIDAQGDFTLLYEPITDPLIRRLLAYRRLLPPSPSTLPLLPSPLLSSPFIRSLYSSLPFAPNLTKPDWLPTKALSFLERLRDKLPAHRLLVADFSELPDSIEGRNGPVVQTRYGGSIVPCETFLVKQGYFDIFFPTDFSILKSIYSLIMNSPSTRLDEKFFTSHPNPTNITPSNLTSGVKGFRRRQVSVYDQSDFLMRFGDRAEILDRTRLRDGENIMLQMYRNAKIMF